MTETLHIGNEIRNELLRQGRSVAWLARGLDSNFYRVLVAIENLIFTHSLARTFKRLSTGFSHQASVFKIHASVHVQLSPMTFCSARREALSQPTIGKPLKCAVYPSEAKRLFHYFDVRNSWPLGWTLAAISHHPATFLLAVVLVEPLPQLRAGAEV